MYLQPGLDGVFYQLLPKMSYLAPNEDAKKVRGTKAMRAKSRITLAVSRNASGSHILPPYFIGKAKKPMCWSLATREERLKLATIYTEQKNAWMEVISLESICFFGMLK